MRTEAPGLSLVRSAAVMAALLVGLTLAGCGDDDSEDSSSRPIPSASVDAPADAADDDRTAGDGAGGDSGSDDDSGPAFDSDGDAVVHAVLAATRGDRAEWEGESLIIHVTEGSAEDLTSGPKCGAGIVLAADEQMILRFPDGEIDCSQ